MLIQELLIEEVTKKLDAAKAKYFIVMEDGKEFGNLEVVRKDNGALKKPRGARTSYAHLYRDILNTMQIGDVIEVDPVEWGVSPAKATSLLQAAMINKWGRGSTKTVFNTKTGKIEALRML